VKGVSKYKGVLAGFFILLITLSNCQPSNKRPSNVLSEEEMVTVLAEVYITEEKVNVLALPPDSAEYVFRQLKSRVFRNLNVTDSVFQESLDFYMTEPKRMEKIYATLVDSLQLREQRTPARAQPQ
jgi:hypothetical protein